MSFFTSTRTFAHSHARTLTWAKMAAEIHRDRDTQRDRHRETDGQTAHRCTDSFSKGSLLFTVTRIPQFKSANLPAVNYCQSRILILGEAPQFPTKPSSDAQDIVFVVLERGYNYWWLSNKELQQKPDQMRPGQTSLKIDVHTPTPATVSKQAPVTKQATVNKQAPCFSSPAIASFDESSRTICKIN